MTLSFGPSSPPSQRNTVENKVCNKCGGLCDSCRERLLEKVTEIAGLMVAEAVRISVGQSGNRCFSIPPAPEKKREPKR